MTRASVTWRANPFRHEMSDSPVVFKRKGNAAKPVQRAREKLPDSTEENASETAEDSPNILAAKLKKKITRWRKLPDIVVDQIRHVEVATAVYSHPGGTWPSADLKQEASCGVELLDALVELVDHVDIAAAVHGYSNRFIELSFAMA